MESLLINRCQRGHEESVSRCQMGLWGCIGVRGVMKSLLIGVRSESNRCQVAHHEFDKCQIRVK